MDVFITFEAMKKYTLLFIALFIVSCSSDEEELPFYVADNGLTIKARDWVTAGASWATPRLRILIKHQFNSI